MPADTQRPVLHGLSPITGPAPRILVLGSFPSILSLGHSEYYGNPRNRFWAVMERVLDIPAGLPYAERTRRLTQRGVALWDVVASCERPGSADSRIRNPVPNDLAGFFYGHSTLRLVALNGTAAARLYHRFAEIPGLPSITLPSTSPANAAMGFEEKVRQWSAALR